MDEGFAGITPRVQAQLQEGKVELIAMLKDAAGNITQHTEEFSVTYAPGQENAALFQILAATRGAGGFIRKLGDGHIEYIPFSRVHSVEFKLSKIMIATSSDLTRLGPLPTNKR